MPATRRHRGVRREGTRMPAVIIWLILAVACGALLVLTEQGRPAGTGRTGMR